MKYDILIYIHKQSERLLAATLQLCVHLFIHTAERQPVSYVKYVSIVTMKSSATVSSPVTMKSSVTKNSSANIWEILSNITIPIIDHKLRCGFMIRGGRGAHNNNLSMPRWGENFLLWYPK